MDRKAVTAWVEAYERAWRAAGTDQLNQMLSADVEYIPSAWRRLSEASKPCGHFRQASRDGPDEVFRMTHEVVAVNGTTAVVLVAVDYHGSDSISGDLWVVSFGDDRRCVVFEEWPFSPDHADGHRAPASTHANRHGGGSGCGNPTAAHA